jgi:hypothetical protein
MTFSKRVLVPRGQPLTLQDIHAGLEVRYHGRRAIVLATVEERTPSGSAVVLARLRFPRGGEQTVFAGQLEADA